MIIKENQILIEPMKLAGIQDWPTPSTVKQVRSFLGFSNFYRRFIGHYSELAKRTKFGNGHMTARKHSML